MCDSEEMCTIAKSWKSFQANMLLLICGMYLKKKSVRRFDYLSLAINGIFASSVEDYIL